MPRIQRDARFYLAGHTGLAGVLHVRALHRQYGDAHQPLRPGDSLDLESSHALPAMIRRMHDARETGTGHVTLWGTGTPWLAGPRKVLDVPRASALGWRPRIDLWSGIFKTFMWYQESLTRSQKA